MSEQNGEFTLARRARELAADGDPALLFRGWALTRLEEGREQATAFAISQVERGHRELMAAAALGDPDWLSKQSATAFGSPETWLKALVLTTLDHECSPEWAERLLTALKGNDAPELTRKLTDLITVVSLDLMTTTDHLDLGRKLAIALLAAPRSHDLSRLSKELEELLELKHRPEDLQAAFAAVVLEQSPQALANLVGAVKHFSTYEEMDIRLDPTPGLQQLHRHAWGKA